MLSNSYDLISVVVLSYAPSKYYWRTLESVLAQTYPAIELIVSDDGSDEFELEQIEEFIRIKKARILCGLLLGKIKKM